MSWGTPSSPQTLACSQGSAGAAPVPALVCGWDGRFWKPALPSQEAGAHHILGIWGGQVWIILGEAVFPQECTAAMGRQRRGVGPGFQEQCGLPRRLGMLNHMPMAWCPPPTTRKLAWLARGRPGRKAGLFGHAPRGLHRGAAGTGRGALFHSGKGLCGQPGDSTGHRVGTGVTQPWTVVCRSVSAWEEGLMLKDGRRPMLRTVHSISCLCPPPIQNTPAGAQGLCR